ncbi:MAG: M24 family metallopeptidase [Pseudomonadota bacterium]
MKSLKSIPNGQKAEGTFSAGEMKRRITLLRDHMSSEQIDAVLFTSIHNVNYFSDFLYCAFGRPYGLVITHDDATTISANIDGGQPWRRSFGQNLVYTDWQRDNFFQAIQEVLAHHGKIKLGIEFDHMTMERLDKLKEALPRAEIVDIAAATMAQRMVKSDEEIALIKEGARIADIGGFAAVEAIQVGAGEHEIALHATSAMVREIAKAFPNAELMDTWTWLQSGINTDGAHNPVTSRRLQLGDILSLNCFPMIAGYYTALERTLFCESASDQHLRYWAINTEVHYRGLELIKPGKRCCDIAAELNEIYQRHGVLDRRTFGYGHSFGVLSHYYGREAGLELREDIETVLQPKMVVSMEPMIMIPEAEPGAGGYREHDILVVTEDSAENITAFPIGPDNNIIRKSVAV